MRLESLVKLIVELVFVYLWFWVKKLNKKLLKLW